MIRAEKGCQNGENPAESAFFQESPASPTNHTLINVHVASQARSKTLSTKAATGQGHPPAGGGTRTASSFAHALLHRYSLCVVNLIAAAFNALGSEESSMRAYRRECLCVRGEARRRTTACGSGVKGPQIKRSVTVARTFPLERDSRLGSRGAWIDETSEMLTLLVSCLSG